MDSVGGHQYGPVHRIQRLAQPADKIRAYSPRVLLEADQSVPGPYRVGAEPLAYRPQQDPLELTPMHAELGIAESGLQRIEPDTQLSDLLALLVDLAVETFVMQPQSRDQATDPRSHNDDRHDLLSPELSRSLPGDLNAFLHDAADRRDPRSQISGFRRLRVDNWAGAGVMAPSVLRQGSWGRVVSRPRSGGRRRARGR